MGSVNGATSLAVEKPGFLASLRNHPPGFWFIFWGEFAERSSYYGMRAILARYMAQRLGLGEADAGTFMSFFIAACYFLPLVGGYVADRFFGKYWTIVGFSVPYILGHVILGVESFEFLVIALTLLAMGSGVIKPNISTLMGLTYDQQRPGQTQLRTEAFSIFYFAINLGAAISQFAMPPLRTNYGYAIAFMFPAALMAVSFAIFAMGKKYYAKETVGPVALSPDQARQRWEVLGRIIALFLLVMFFWAIFDQSTSTWIFFANACMSCRIFGTRVDPDQIQAFNAVFIILMLPVITVLFKGRSEQGKPVRATDKMVIGFLLTALCMGVMAFAAWLAGAATLQPATVHGDGRLAVVGTPNVFTGQLKLAQTNIETMTLDKMELRSKDVVWSNAATRTDVASTIRFTGEHLKIVPNEQGGFAIDGVKKIAFDSEDPATKHKLTATVAEGDLHLSLQPATDAVLSSRSTWFVAPEDQVSVWWQVFAYFIITIAEILISVTGLELAYIAAPKSMTGFVTACWLATVGLANFLINAPITRVYTAIQPMFYFAMLSAALLTVAVAFVFVARRFNRLADDHARQHVDRPLQPPPSPAGVGSGIEAGLPPE